MIPETTLPYLLKLAQMISKAKLQAETRAKATHGRFNVFTTLLQAHDEVRLHTRFLHCLLDPKGLHDCGSLFLRLFFETLGDRLSTCDGQIAEGVKWPSANERWEVSKEAGKSHGHGQMDLFLNHPSGFGIVIENKIYADEQPGQIAGYAAFLRNRFGENSRLIYLTLDGKESVTHENNAYIPISYYEDILAWLEKCLQATYNIIPVNQVILQYREVVRQLTNQTIDSENMKPIIEFARKNSDIIRYRKEIATAAEEVIQQTWDQIEEGIKNGMPVGFMVNRSRRTTQKRFGEGTYGALVIVPPEGNPLSAAPFEIWAERDEYSFGVGVVHRDDDFRNSQFTKVLSDKMVDQLSKDNDTTDRFPLGWLNLIPGVSDEEFASVVEDPNISKICNTIKKYIVDLQDIYVAAKDEIDTTTVQNQIT